MFGKKLKCSFCGKTEDDVEKLIAGAKAFICNECVATAARIMRETGSDPAGTVEPLPTASRKSPA